MELVMELVSKHAQKSGMEKKTTCLYFMEWVSYVNNNILSSRDFFRSWREKRVFAVD